jgi:hypothetical protein
MANWWCPWTLPSVVPTLQALGRRAETNWAGCRACSTGVAALCRRGMALPPPLVVADSWFGDSKLMRHVATTHQGTLLVEGKSTYVFELPDGQ